MPAEGRGIEPIFTERDLADRLGAGQGHDVPGQDYETPFRLPGTWFSNKVGS